MERRVLIAIFLSFLVLYTYQALFIKPAPKQPAAPAPPVASTGNAGSATAPAAVPTPSAPAPAGPAATADIVVGDAAERDVRVETDRVIAVFTNRGARLKSWRLKKYLDQHRDPVELVANDLPDVTLPFTLRLDDEAASRALETGLYRVTGAPADGVIGASTRIGFEYQDSSGLHATKEFTLEPASYVIAFRAAVSQGDRALSPAIVWGPALGDLDSGSGRYAVKPRGLLSLDNSVRRLSASDVTKQAGYDGSFQYAGVDDHYFMTTALGPGESISIVYEHTSIPPAAGSKDPARELMSYTIRPGQKDGLRFYVGPKDFSELEALDPAGRTFVRAIDFGRFDIVVVPLLRALKWIYGFVGNYGWAIIILTVLINAAMFPLRHKSVVSMRKMQEIQPEAKKIQDRYASLKATDPAKQKMNQELMALYRERGVNPASGCVPMLLTFPVLFAFYALLTTAIELRGAPFFGWIHDLSLPDPYYVTPVLMGISQIWQTRITPQAGTDPAQQKMMMFMPVLFMFFFLWAPAGVAIYWLISNVWGIGQQYLTNYLIGPPNIRAARPAAERRVKRVGAGKTEAAAREN